MEDYMTLEELSEKLRVSKGYLYNLCCKGRIPHKKIGKLIRFVPSDIERWIDLNSEGDGGNGKHLQEKL